MNKKKASTVTVIFAVMLAAIDIGLYKLYPIGFAILTGILALFGFWELAQVFSSWLTEKEEEPLSLPEMTGEPIGVSPEFSATFDEIMAEVEAEREKTS